MMRVLGMGEYVLSCHPEDIEHVLAGNFENYPKADFLLPVLQDLIGRGIFSVNGEDWILQRKAASNAFRVRDIKHSLDVFRRVAHDLIAVMDAHEGQEVDMVSVWGVLSCGC